MIKELIANWIAPYIYEKHIKPGSELLPGKYARNYLNIANIPVELKAAINFLAASLSRSQWTISFANKQTALEGIQLNRLIAFAVKDWIYDRCIMRFESNIPAFYVDKGIGEPIYFNFAPYLLKIEKIKHDLAIVAKLKTSIAKAAENNSKVYIAYDYPVNGGGRGTNADNEFDDELTQLIGMGGRISFSPSSQSQKQSTLKELLDNITSSYAPVDKTVETLSIYIDTLLIPICECFKYDLNILFKDVAKVNYSKISLMDILPTTTAELQMLIAQEDVLTREEKRSLLGFE